MKLQTESGHIIDTNSPIDISLQLSNTKENPRAWYVDFPRFEPVMANGFVGSISAGGSVNFRDIFFNPHGHGTHTECLGHITKEVYSVNEVLKTFFFEAKLVTVRPKQVIVKENEFDYVIQKEDLADAINDSKMEAIVIRTLPNDEDKKSKNYSSTNPPYLSIECIDILNEAGVKHLLIDLPSVDRENDGGALVFHHAFWQVPENPRFDKTITELIFVENDVEDGEYILEIQMAAFKNDASPSRPVLYKKVKED